MYHSLWITSFENLFSSFRVVKLCSCFKPQNIYSMLAIYLTLTTLHNLWSKYPPWRNMRQLKVRHMWSKPYTQHIYWLEIISTHSGLGAYSYYSVGCLHRKVCPCKTSWIVFMDVMNSKQQWGKVNTTGMR